MAMQVKAVLTILLKSTLFPTSQQELLHPMVQGIGHVDVASLIYHQPHRGAKLPGVHTQAPPPTQKNPVGGIALNPVLPRSGYEKGAV